MRILSSFHDYYDSAMSEGQDRSCVFLRHADPITTLGLGFERRLQELVPRVRYVNVKHRGGRALRTWSEQVAESFVVLLGGRLYPGVRFYHGDRMSGPDEAGAVFVYSLAEVEIECRARGIPWDERSFLSKRTAGDVYAAFFKLDGDGRFLADAVTERLPLCLVVRPTHDAQLRIERNPVLRELAFYRRLDAWQTFQELSMFIGGVLAPENQAMAAISDVDRLAQRGFDKRSFRHR